MGAELELVGRGRGRGRGAARGRGRGRAAFAERVAPTAAQGAVATAPLAPVALATLAGVQHMPTAMERNADPAHLQIIRDMYGSRAQTLINALLAFDALLAWYYPLKRSIGFLCDKEIRERRALENMQTAIDMHEIYERATISHHKSFMVHAAIFKCTKDILRLGDSWAAGLDSLELLNAETKRTATSAGARNLTIREEGVSRKPLTTKEGPAQLVVTRGCNTSMAISTLRSSLTQQYLRRGDGIASIPDSRRKVRLFQQGHTKLRSAGNSAADRAAEYDPRSHTCLEAFIELIAELVSNE